MNFKSDEPAAEIVAVTNDATASFTIDGVTSANGAAQNVVVSANGETATKTVKIILKEKINDNAMKLYGIETVVKKYLNCIEELINIPRLIDYFNIVRSRGDLKYLLDEIVIQSKTEFNFKTEVSQ